MPKHRQAEVVESNKKNKLIIVTDQSLLLVVFSFFLGFMVAFFTFLNTINYINSLFREAIRF